MAGHVVVTGASGQVGRGVAERLLARGVAVRAVGRSTERLAGLSAKGAEPAVGSLEDAAFLAKAFAGARSVFAIVPPDYAAEDMQAKQGRIIDAMVGALRAAGAPPTVALSSQGAERSSGTGPIVVVHRFEQALAAAPGLPHAVLRPAYFMENHLGSLPVIRQHGVIGGTLSPDRPFPQVATRDIAGVAADLLAKSDFRGRQVVSLLGPRDYTMNEVAATLGRAISRPDLAYVRLEEKALKDGLVAAGFASAVAELFLELNRAIDAGLSDVVRSAENTTPTTLEQFAADTFAPAYSS
jgi:uncharacterized protein YbjT (DUF2867 family)